MANPVDSFTTQSQIDSYLNTLSQKYTGNDQYIVSATNSGPASASVTAIAPYLNLSNRYFPTVATIPNLSNNLKTHGELGGYFIPSNLGASIYLTKNITYVLDTDQLENGVVYNYIDPSRFNKGRGLTLNDQDNVITHYIDTDWMKSTNTSDSYDGHLINTDSYQKFIPYQSSYETTKSDSNGVVNSRYDFEFWSGDQKQTWTEPNSATQLTPEKYFDLNTKLRGLVLTPGKELYSWQTDIFGNQYSLYKPVFSPRSAYRSLSSAGELWVKTTDSTINIGPSALSLLYSNYEDDTSIFNQLKDNSILNFEVFLDTLVIQLSSTVLYEKITYNYNSFTIEKSLQNFLPLTYGVTDSTALSTRFLDTLGIVSPTSETFYGGNWYNTADKIITICTLLSSCLSGSATSIISVSGLSSMVVPVLYQVNLNNPQERKRIYPNATTSAQSYLEYIYPMDGDSGNGISYMESPVFCYNEDSKLFFTTFIAFSGTSQQLKLITYKT